MSFFFSSSSLLSSLYSPYPLSSLLGTRLGSGRALPRDIEDRLLPPDLTPQQEERMRERERERAREAEKQA